LLGIFEEIETDALNSKQQGDPKNGSSHLSHELGISYSILLERRLSAILRTVLTLEEPT